ncbi:helix-turn-helix transcriptional regulator [Pseudomonas berkeleyensis]|uniref:Helix-turn-helix transcriptional regulator n=1 Tax=Pseudomonas berkeleyensis TaxID=2726956 RepID=A0A7G5DTU5_9PSED|nr:helix-turn-helix transcriptional regulator [Pseudomonas berkeleyensis]QMV65170.1 helix-turn-helix transcriptional regulator [Pseudomonas berkeleyensis]WSO40643.1 helix-turn-helix transcriptional regulator [Pseudomonas berkeleyensis]
MNRISEIRRAAGISQLALVDQLRWSQGRVSNYESGRRVPGLTECRAIVRALNVLGADCSLDDVFPPEAEQVPAAA